MAPEAQDANTGVFLIVTSPRRHHREPAFVRLFAPHEMTCRATTFNGQVMGQGQVRSQA